jgi:hypothetical protein
MASLVPQNIEELTFLDAMQEEASLSKAVNNGITIAMGRPLNPSISGLYIMEKRDREVEREGQTVTEQYYSKVWLVSDILSTDTMETLHRFMDLLLDGTYQHIEVETLTLPEDNVELNP